MASLLGELQESGSRLEDGTPNAGGKCWFYQPGTTSPVNVYTDAELTAVASQPVTLDDGGRIPTADYPDGIWLTQRVRLYVEDSGGGLVSDTTYTPADAGNSALENDYFSGTTVEEAFTAIGASVGGVDGKYLESGGATPRLIQDKFRETGISVKDFGAVGNGVAIDTLSIQTAMNRAAALGTNVLVPAGSYKIDGALAMTNATGVRIIGAGYGATTITSTHATANMFTFDTCASCGFEGLSLAGTSTGKVIDADDCPGLVIRGVSIVDNTYAYGIDATGTTSVSVYDSFIRGSTRSIRYNVNGTYGSTVFASVLEGSVEYLGGSHDSGIVRSQFISGSILLGTGLTGTRFTFVGATGASAITVSTSLANDPLVYQEGCGLDTNATSSATTATQTPVVINGARQILLTAASGGAGVITVAAPAVLPDTFDASRIYWFRFRNAAGGAVTWTMNAIYVLVGGVAPVGTDGNTCVMGFLWDPTTSEFREISRATTTT